MKKIANELKPSYKSYLDIIAIKSKGKIYVSNYKSINDILEASCLECGFNWKVKAIDLFNNTKFPNCRKKI